MILRSASRRMGRLHVQRTRPCLLLTAMIRAVPGTSAVSPDLTADVVLYMNPWRLSAVISVCAGCNVCTEPVPTCQQGEILTVSSNITDRCCPSYQCGMSLSSASLQKISCSHNGSRNQPGHISREFVCSPPCSYID